MAFDRVVGGLCSTARLHRLSRLRPKRATFVVFLALSVLILLIDMIPITTIMGGNNGEEETIVPSLRPKSTTPHGTSIAGQHSIGTPIFDTRYPHIQLAMCQHPPYPVRKGSVEENNKNKAKGDDDIGTDSNGFIDVAALVSNVQPDVRLIDRGTGIEVSGSSADSKTTMSKYCDCVTGSVAHLKESIDSAEHQPHLRLSPLFYANRQGTIGSAEDSRQKEDSQKRPSSPPIPHFRVVMGVPTVDTDVGSQRRMLQRSSWLGYSQNYDAHKYRSSNIGRRGLEGAASRPLEAMLLVRYILGRHHSHQFSFSNKLLSEAANYRDILFFEMKEGTPSTSKSSGGGGHWGLEAEVGMSRKALYWYVIAPLMYSFDFIVKGDDDVFLRVPQYFCDLEQKILPFAAGLCISTSEDNNFYAKKQQVDSSLSSHSEGRCPFLNHFFDAASKYFHCGANASHSIFSKHSFVEEEPQQLLHSQFVSAHQCPPLPQSVSISNQGDSSKGQQSLRPIDGIYWGKVMKWKAKKDDPSSEFLFVGGMCITMSRDVAALVSSDTELYRLSAPFVFFADKTEMKKIEEVYASAANIIAQQPVDVFVGNKQRLVKDGKEAAYRPQDKSGGMLGPGGIGDFLTVSLRHLYINSKIGGGTEASAKPLYKVRNMDHEDVMVGRTLYRYARQGDRRSHYDKPQNSSTNGIARELHQRAIANLWQDNHADRTASRQDKISQREDNAEDGRHIKAVAAGHTLRQGLGIVVVDDCRYHDVHAGANQKSITDTSVAVHHVLPSEYKALFERFSEQDNYIPSSSTPVSCRCKDTEASDGFRRGHPVLRLCGEHTQ